jgi:hypothetical protein
MRFKIKNQTGYLEDTGFVKVHNYPSSANTHSYITRTYRHYKEGLNGWVEIDGEPIYFFDLPQELLVLAVIIGNAQNVLFSKLPREKTLMKRNE